MEHETSNSSYKEVRIGNTLYRVTSVFPHALNLGRSLEQLAIRQVTAELAAKTSHADGQESVQSTGHEPKIGGGIKYDPQ